MCIRDTYKIAAGICNQAIEIDSNRYVFFNNLGLALKEQGRLEESIQAYQQAIHIQPGYAEAYNNLGFHLEAKDT